MAGVAGFPGGLKGRLTGLGARPEDGVEGVFGRDMRIAEAGRAGGPIDPLLLTVLDRLRDGDGAGEICERVSIVLSDNEGRGLRFSGLANSSFFASWLLLAFSFPSSIMADSGLMLGGVVSRADPLLIGDAVLVGESMPSDLSVQPNEGLVDVLLLSPSGRISGFRDDDAGIRGCCECFEGSSWWIAAGIDEARAVGSRDMGRAMLLWLPLRELAPWSMLAVVVPAYCRLEEETSHKREHVMLSLTSSETRLKVGLLEPVFFG